MSNEHSVLDHVGELLVLCAFGMAVFVLVKSFQPKLERPRLSQEELDARNQAAHDQWDAWQAEQRHLLAEEIAAAIRRVGHDEEARV